MKLEVSTRRFFGLVLTLCYLQPMIVLAQSGQAEHLSHHPELAAQATAAAGSGQPMSPSVSSGGMGGMMEMHGTPKKEIYPSLIALKNLSPEDRQKVETDAHSRINTALARIGSAIDSLSASQSVNDYVGAQAALQELTGAAAEYSSGIAALRALEEGARPDAIALSWYKSQMSLTEDEPQAPISYLPVFHTLVMTILVLFSGTMIFMYFFKMRRAALLLGRLVAPTALNVPLPAVEPVTGGSMPSTRADLSRFEGELTISEIITESANIKTFRLRSLQATELPFRFIPGQFLTVSVAPKGAVAKRAYSIASSPTHTDYCDLTIKREQGGLVSPYLHEMLRAGDRLKVAGPHGTFTFTGKEAPSILLVAAGVGVTPLMSVLRYLTDTNWTGAISLLFSCRNVDDYLFKDELEERSKAHPNLSVTVTFTGTAPKGWAGLTGRISTEMLRSSIPDLGSTRVHICGPNPMMDAVKAQLLELGMPCESIKLEAFGPSKEMKRIPQPGEPRIATASSEVTFTKSQKKAFLPPNISVLDAADSVGVQIENSCRAGTCGLCKVRLIHGSVTMDVQDALTDDDKRQGFILACEAKSESDVSVEA